MPLVIPDGFGLLSYHHESPDYEGEAIFTLGVDLNAVIPDDALAHDLYDVWQAEFTVNYAADVTLKRAKLLYRLAGVLQVAEWVEDTVGTAGESSNPPNCAVLIGKRTSLAGPKFRGRCYLPALPENQRLNSTNWVSASVASLVAAIEGIADFLDTGGMTAVILHSDATTPTPISSFRGSNRIATQRGRLRN